MKFKDQGFIRKDHPQFGVLLPLIEKDGEWQVLFEKRAAHIIRQPGEICFPGGEREIEDVDLRATAVRECCEELGITADKIEVLAPLDYFVNHRHLYIMAYLGIIHPTAFQIDRREVEEIFTVPLQFLLDYEPQTTYFSFQAEMPQDYPYELIPGGKAYPFEHPRYPQYFYRWENHVIWGLTAGILSQFLQAFKEK